MNNVCVIKECKRRAIKTGLCGTHYKRRMSGDYTISINKTFKGTLHETLNHYSQKADNGCINFTGDTKGGGYGRISCGGKRFMAHRVAYEIAYGPIEMMKDIHHTCGNKKCVNPKHLEALSSHNHIKQLKRDESGRLIAHSKT